MRALIIGCGYVGVPLGIELVRRGHEVFGVRRSSGAEAELSARGIEPLIADIADPTTFTRFPSEIDWIINLVSSGQGGVEAYQRIYVEGMRHLVAWAGARAVQKLVYTSSTSVYGQTGGVLVDERSPTEPESPTSRLLVEAEQVLLRAAHEQQLPSVVLRVAGIYGPGRGHLFHQFLRGEARLDPDEDRMLNMIHLDDLVEVIIAALERGKPGAVYNVVDDAPVAQRAFFEWLAHELGRPLPPVASEPGARRRKRGLTNKRVSNRKLRDELGCALKFPSFREGYRAAIQETDRS